MKPTTRQIARAWNGITQEYGVRRNKAYEDGKQFEVYCCFGDGSLKVLGRYAVHGLAEDHADSLDNDARAKAVLKLFA